MNGMNGIFTGHRGDRGPLRRERLCEPKYWSEGDPEVFHDAVMDACRIYEYRNLRENLKNLSWKRARRQVLAHGALSNEWASHQHGDVRLRRGGLEIRLPSGTKLLGWQKLRELIQNERA